jgi:uncharacterized membrane protein YesL
VTCKNVCHHKDTSLINQFFLVLISLWSPHLMPFIGIGWVSYHLASSNVFTNK